MIESACANRAKSIPKNATIRKEYVNCKKPKCYHGRTHGPYYYAYWKEGSKIKKKYIGQYRYEGQLQQGQQQDTAGVIVSSNNNKIRIKSRKRRKNCCSC